MKRILALSLIAATGCGLPAGGIAGAPTSAPREGLWHYDVALSDDLSRMDVRLTFAGNAPPRLVLGDSGGLPYLADVAAGGAPLPRDGDAFVAGGGDPTIAYRVDFAKLVDDGRGTRVGRDRCASPAFWLLRPARPPAAPHATLTLHVPAGAGASVPWPRDDSGVYLLDETTFRWRGVAAFGPMEQHTLTASGATFDVSILDFPHAASWAGIERWLTDGASAASSLYECFPVPHVQIVVKPVPSNQAVAFGEVQRGGGPAVLFRIGSETQDTGFGRDWVAAHEFSHLGMPAIPEDDVWLSEGFIQYYTETLRGRAGLIDERAAWQEMVAGFDRGRSQATGRTLAEDSVSMSKTHSFMHVYWGGAAIALLLDVELRRHAAGDLRSLDDAIREVSRAFAGRPRETTAAEIVAHVDNRLGRPLFAETSARWLASAEFPDVAPALADLGVVVEGGRVTLDDDAPLAAIRRAIGGGAAAAK